MAAGGGGLLGDEDPVAATPDAHCLRRVPHLGPPAGMAAATASTAARAKPSACPRPTAPWSSCPSQRTLRYCHSFGLRRVAACHVPWQDYAAAGLSRKPWCPGSPRWIFRASANNGALRSGQPFGAGASPTNPCIPATGM